MRAVIALLLFSLGASGASNNNTIIALVNENVITFKSIENQLIDTNSLDEKLEIIDSQLRNHIEDNLPKYKVNLD